MSKRTVLCVDDEGIILESLKVELRPVVEPLNIQIELADSGNRALEIVKDIISQGDELLLILSDQRMPGMKGDEFLVQAHQIAPLSLKILLTGYTDVEAVKNAVNNANLYRYLTKPWESNDLSLTVKEALEKYIQERLIEEKNEKIEKLTIAMVSALENANFYNDEDTGSHIRRVTEYSRLLAKLADYDEVFVRKIGLYSSLHDIGKVGIDRAILNKEGRYTSEEFETMKAHVQIGYHLLENDEIDPMARNIALYHHEKWDGSGYLAHLAGEDIPPEARIVSIVDVFDALITRRIYKPAYSLKESLDIMREGRGKHFDPRLLDVFLSNTEQFITLRSAS